MALVQTYAAPLADRAAAYLVGLVPAVSAETLAVCRILIGVALVYFYLHEDPHALGGGSLTSVATIGPRIVGGMVIDQTGLLTFLSGSSWSRTTVHWSIIALAAMFAAGVATRTVFAALTALMWLAALMANRGHFLTPLLLGITVTLAAPWGAAWSIDAWRSRQPAGPASPCYGYAIWLLGLCIGLAYAAAGLSKLVLTDGAWLWNTGARNGFIQDLNLALTDTGMWLSNNYVLAVAASAISSLGQIAYVYTSFTHSERVKYAICFLIALPFLLALVLTMGLFWWPWGLLVLILYLPWKAIDRRTAGRATPRFADFPDTPTGRWQSLLCVEIVTNSGSWNDTTSAGKQF